MHEVENFSELPTAPPAPGFLCCGFLPSMARANRQQLMNSTKDHLPARGTGAAEVRREDGIATTGIGFLSDVELLFLNAVWPYSASSTLILKTPNINNSTSTQMQMYYTHRYTSMYIFSCRGNMIFMLYKMNEENRKPRILGYRPNHTALKSAVRWKKNTQQKKPLHFLPRKVSKFSNLFTTDVYPQETKIWAGWDRTGIRHQKPLLPELGNNTISVSTEADLVLQNSSPKLLYLLLISNESVNTSVGYYSSRLILFIFLFSELISLPQHLLTAPTETWFKSIQRTQMYSNFFL